MNVSLGLFRTFCGRLTLLVHLVALRRVRGLRIVGVQRVAPILLHLLDAVGLRRVVTLHLTGLTWRVSDRRQLRTHSGGVRVGRGRGLGRVGGTLGIGLVGLRRRAVSLLLRLALVVFLLLARLPLFPNFLELCSLKLARGSSEIFS